MVYTIVKKITFQLDFWQSVQDLKDVSKIVELALTVVIPTFATINELELCKTCKTELYLINKDKYFPKVECECGKSVYKYYLPKHLQKKNSFFKI